jgi:hypothetical protein
MNAYLDELDDDADEDAINLNWNTYLGASIQKPIDQDWNTDLDGQTEDANVDLFWNRHSREEIENINRCYAEFTERNQIFL